MRSEIVTLGVKTDLTAAGTKLTPTQFHDLIQDPDVVVFDARNNYESAIGKIRGAITPNISLFKELPEALNCYEELKEKKVVTYCTGGIRCEKASALMIKRGFKHVYQLEGGIINYAKNYPDGASEGECFVFDDRMSVVFKINRPCSVVAGCAMPRPILTTIVQIRSATNSCSSASNAPTIARQSATGVAT